MKRGRATVVVKRGRVVGASKKKKEGELSPHSVQSDNSTPNSTETFQNPRPHISQCGEVGDPNLGDTPSYLELYLMNLALQKYNQEIVQLVQERPDVFSWVELAFGGGLLINSFTDDGIWCHINFEAKVLINADGSMFGEDGPCLLFAELRRPYGKLDYEVVSCHNLGPSKNFQKPRLRGCKACDTAPFQNLLKHPNRKFNVGPVDNVPKIGEDS